MGIDYAMGFKDATKTMELETNRIINSIEIGNRKEMANAINSFISTVYVLRLQSETLEEEMFEEMKEEEMDCTFCDMLDECMELSINLEKLFKEVF